MHQPTIEKLHALRLNAMADALMAQLRQPEIDAMPLRLALVVDVQPMLSAALEQRLRRAGMRQSARVENLGVVWKKSDSAISG